MKPTHSFRFLASSIVALSIAHTASGIGYDANTTLNSAVTSTDGVSVGVANSNVTLTVDNGGSLGITSGSISAGVNNEALVVNGTGSLTMVANSNKNIHFDTGSGQSITVQGGGTMALVPASGVTNSGTLYLGSTSLVAPSTFTVTGSGSTFTNGSASWGANIWLSGSNAQIVVSNGGVFTSPKLGIYIAGRFGGNQLNSLTIDGAGSQLTTNAAISLNPSQGAGYGASYSTLTISNGGVANSGSGNISNQAGVSNMTATVTGPGSSWNLHGGNLQVGNHVDPTASDNAMNVSNGGSLSNVGSVLMNGSNNQFNLGSGGADAISTATAGTVTLTSSSAQLNINNGRLIANADGTLVSGAGTVNLLGGANISTAFSGSSISTVITGTGSLTKEGTGTLDLTALNTYTGDTTVTATGGVLKMENATLGDNSHVNLFTGGKLNLNTGGATDTIGALYLDGVLQTLGGTWGSSASGADNQNDTFFSGTGKLLTSALVPEPTVALLSGLGLLGLLRRRRSA